MVTEHILIILAGCLNTSCVCVPGSSPQRLHQCLRCPWLFHRGQVLCNNTQASSSSLSESVDKSAPCVYPNDCKSLRGFLEAKSCGITSLLLLVHIKVLVIMQVCDDTIEEDDGEGNQRIFRVIRVPFRVVFVSGNLKMRFHVQQSRQDGKVIHAVQQASNKSTLFAYNACIHSHLNAD